MSPVMLTMSSRPETAPRVKHRPIPTSVLISSNGSLSIPRIRILLAPYMSPYVVPFKKVQTWELLLNLLSNLFGPSILTSILKITDTQGNLIHRHVWEDLIEPGMTIIVDTGSVSAFNKERAVKEKGKEKDRGKQTLATLSLRPSQDATVEQIPSPRLIGTTAINKIASTSNFQSEKLPAEKIADWALNVPLSEDVEGKRVTTPGLESIKNKESQTETRDEFVQGQAMASAGERASNTVPPERKKSKATRMADCLNGIKSRYGSTSTKETTLAPSPAAGITVAQITATAPKPAKSKRPASRPETKSSPPTTTNTNTAQKPAKFKAPVPSPETKRSSPMRTYTTTASGAISNQPLKGETKKPRRTKSLRAFFRYFEEERPRSASRMRSQSTPASKSSNFSPVTPASPIRRPTTSPTVGTRSPAAIKRGGKTQNSSRPASPRNPASGKQRTGTTDTVAPNAKRAALLKASLDKPLPKLPYKFSTFPAPTPPRSPIIKAAANPLSVPQPQQSTLISGNKIVPFSELNRRLAKESIPMTRLHKSSLRSHQRDRSADSQTSSTSIVSRPATTVTTAEVAINGFGMKGKLIGVGKPGAPRALVASREERETSRSVRRVASEDTIRNSWREQRSSDVRRPKTANERKVGLGIETLVVQGGKTIAIGVDFNEQ